jgi:alanine racemase
MSRSRKNKPGSLVWAEIDLGRLKGNLRAIRRMARGSQILAIVKADAYGHGMAAVAKALHSQRVRLFGVASLEEALRLRETLPLKEADILVLGSFHRGQVADYVRARIRPTISSLEDLRNFESGVRGGRAPVHVKVDTGMGRLGVWHEEALKLFKAVRDSRAVELEGVYTHFSSADDSGADFTRLQSHRFETILEKLGAMGLKPRFVHAANSLGLARFPNARLNLVRPGLLLYGLNPGGSAWTPPASVKPVMSLKARISFLKTVQAEQPLSYGRTYQTAKATRIATLPVGYSHGYRVGYSNKGFVLVKGKRCPVVGRVTMDHTLIDVGTVPGIRRWDTVTLLGSEKSAQVSAEELAGWIGTIPYEVVCAVHSRIPRVYKGLKKASR